MAAFKRSVKQCNSEIYERGVSFGVYDMAKDEADAFCETQTEETDNFFDWHYYGGRVHVKYLPKAEFEEPASSISTDSEVIGSWS